MELGEGLCKLRKMNFENGPFHQFEREITALLEFIYQTQLEQAACEFLELISSFFFHFSYLLFKSIDPNRHGWTLHRNGSIGEIIPTSWGLCSRRTSLSPGNWSKLECLHCFLPWEVSWHSHRTTQYKDPCTYGFWRTCNSIGVYVVIFSRKMHKLV